MAFQTPNGFFRTPIFNALSAPVSTPAASYTARMGHALVMARIYNDNLGAVNFDTNSDIGAAPYTSNEVATSGSGGMPYTNGVAAGVVNGTWSTAPSLTKGSTAAGTAIQHGANNINCQWTGVTWIPGVTTAGYGCVLFDNSASLTVRWLFNTFIFTAPLTPSNGLVTLTWAQGFHTINA